MKVRLCSLVLVTLTVACGDDAPPPAASGEGGSTGASGGAGAPASGAGGMAAGTGGDRGGGTAGSGGVAAGTGGERGGGTAGSGGMTGGSTGAGGMAGGRGGAGGGAGGSAGGGAGRGGSAGGGGAPAGTASCAMLHYCDDFEAYAVGSQPGAPWTKSTGGGATMMVDGTKPYGGTKALHIKSPLGASSHATISQKMGAAVPIAGNNLFGRVMVFFGNTDTNDLPKGVHSWIFNVAGNSAAVGSVGMNLGGGVPRYQLNYHWQGMEQAKVGGMWTAGAWHCVQWQYDSSGMPAKNEARVWVDNALVLTIPGTTGWNFATPWNAIDLGFTHYQTLANPVEVWLDDFALNDSMVACPTKP